MTQTSRCPDCAKLGAGGRCERCEKLRLAEFAMHANKVQAQEIRRLEADVAKCREVATVVDWVQRSRGYPTPKEWDEVVRIAKAALSRQTCSPGYCPKCSLLLEGGGGWRGLGCKCTSDVTPDDTSAKRVAETSKARHDSDDGVGAMLHSTMDATVWAREFCLILADSEGNLTEDTMRAWFANAIMCGYDIAHQRMAASKSCIPGCPNKGCFGSCHNPASEATASKVPTLGQAGNGNLGEAK